MPEQPDTRSERGDATSGQGSGRRSRFHGDYGVALVVAVFCLAAWYVSTTFERAAPALVQGIQPADFPRLVLYVMLVLAAVVAFQAIGKEDPGRRHQPPVVWYTVAAVIGFAAIAEWVDVLLAIAFFYLVVSWLWGERSPVRLVGIAAALPVAIYVVFGEILEVRFPRGLITNLIYG